jgi:hypothetical protein
LNAALPGLLETGLPLGIIPLGTANDLARTLGIPTDLAAAARIIACAKVQRVDIGEVNGHPFFNVASIGFGVDLTRALTRDSKRRFGTIGYAIAALRAVSRLRPFRAEIMHGHTIHISRTIHVAVGNGRHYGGGMTVSEHARIDDGCLHIYSLEVDSLWRLLRLLPALRSGRHDGWKEIRTLEGEEIEVRTPRRPRSVNRRWRNRHADAGALPCPRPCDQRVHPMMASTYFQRLRIPPQGTVKLSGLWVGETSAVGHRPSMTISRDLCIQAILPGSRHGRSSQSFVIATRDQVRSGSNVVTLAAMRAVSGPRSL